MQEQTEKNHCSKPDTSLMNLNESFSENNVLLSDENKVIIYIFIPIFFLSKWYILLNHLNKT